MKLMETEEIMIIQYCGINKYKTNNLEELQIMIAVK